MQLCIQKGPGRDLSRCTTGNLISKLNQTARLPDSTLSGIHSNTDSYRRLQRALRPRISETSHTLDIAKDKSNRRCPRDGCVYPFLERVSYIYAFRSVVYIPFRRGLLRVVCSDDIGHAKASEIKNGQCWRPRSFECPENLSFLPLPIGYSRQKPKADKNHRRR